MTDRPSAMEALYGGAPKAVHRCGNCILWSCPVGEGVGACEGYSDVATDPPAFRGISYRHATGSFMTTADGYCDMQTPIPPPGPPCPKCGADMVEGFGLMGGGYGAYEACVAPGCGHFTKHEVPEDWQ